MKRIISSLFLLTFVIGTITFGATKAFFNDTETSVANVLTAGAIDLKVDNESYYNGLFNTGTSWAARDLTEVGGHSIPVDAVRGGHGLQLVVEIHVSYRQVDTGR